MEFTELLDIWKTQNEKIERSIKLNEKIIQQSIHQKAASTLQPLIRIKRTNIIVTVFYLLILAYALLFTIKYYDSSRNYFIVSVSAIFLINLKALADYIIHLNMAKAVNFNGSVVEVQQQLSELQFSIINHAKTMCLQFPFFTTFYLSNQWFPQEVGLGYIIFQVLLTGSFIYASYWLYKNHRIDNLNKKWFRTLIAGSGGKSVLKAMEFYKELEEFKNH